MKVSLFLIQLFLSVYTFTLRVSFHRDFWEHGFQATVKIP